MYSFSQIKAFIERLPDTDQILVKELHEFLTKQPGVKASIRYGVPFYEKNRWICYLNPLAKGGVELAFPKAHLMNGHRKHLEFKDRKQVGGIVIKEVDDLSKLVELPSLTVPKMTPQELKDARRRLLKKAVPRKSTQTPKKPSTSRGRPSVRGR